MFLSYLFQADISIDFKITAQYIDWSLLVRHTTDISGMLILHSGTGFDIIKLI